MQYSAQPAVNNRCHVRKGHRSSTRLLDNGEVPGQKSVYFWSQPQQRTCNISELQPQHAPPTGKSCGWHLAGEPPSSGGRVAVVVDSPFMLACRCRTRQQALWWPSWTRSRVRTSWMRVLHPEGRRSSWRHACEARCRNAASMPARNNDGSTSGLNCFDS